MRSFAGTYTLPLSPSLSGWAVGYSLAFSSGSSVIGDLTYLFHRGVGSEPVGTIPAVLFS
jgi:ammonia channel protein AmtB